MTPSAERYMDRKLAGLCGVCGKNPAREDAVVCDGCFERRRRWQQRAARPTATKRRCGKCRGLGHFAKTCEAVA